MIFVVSRVGTRSTPDDSRMLDHGPAYLWRSGARLLPTRFGFALVRTAAGLSERQQHHECHRIHHNFHNSPPETWIEVIQRNPRATSALGKVWGFVLSGVAIAASLVPPIATSGMRFVLGALTISGGAALLFWTNFLAIVLGSAARLWSVGIRDSHEHG